MRRPRLDDLAPFLLASYPTLSLLAHNAGEVPILVGLRPLLASLALAAILVLLFTAILRDRDKALLCTSLTVVMLLSYGHVYSGLKLAGLSGTTLVRHRYLLPVYLIVLAAGLVAASRLRRIEGVARPLSLIAAVVAGLPLTTLGMYTLQSAQSGTAPAGPACTLSPEQATTFPDIYLIVMDAYERDDVLLQVHGYDNSPFLRELEAMGFYVARGSLSNYGYTVLTFASMLNLDYVQAFPDRYDPESQNRWGLAQMIPDNRVRRELECLGYHIVAIETGVFWTEWSDADYYLSMDESPFRSLNIIGEASRFEALLLDTTIVRAALDWIRISRAAQVPDSLDPTNQHRQRVLFAFDQLSQAARLPSPKFVYAHILSPHSPFVFGQEESAARPGAFESEFAAAPSEDEDLGAYARQVDFLNDRIINAVRSIMASSESPPVIVITGDHGWVDRNPEGKLSILHAYHLPGIANDLVYPTISPVNSFRLIFRGYFDRRFELLDDVSYYSSHDRLFAFTEVSNSWPGP